MKYETVVNVIVEHEGVKVTMDPIYGLSVGTKTGWVAMKTMWPIVVDVVVKHFAKVPGFPWRAELTEVSEYVHKNNIWKEVDTPTVVDFAAEEPRQTVAFLFENYHTFVEFCRDYPVTGPSAYITMNQPPVTEMGIVIKNDDKTYNLCRFKNAQAQSPAILKGVSFERACAQAINIFNP